MKESGLYKSAGTTNAGQKLTTTTLPLSADYPARLAGTISKKQKPLGLNQSNDQQMLMLSSHKQGNQIEQPSSTTNQRQRQQQFFTGGSNPPSQNQEHQLLMAQQLMRHNLNSAAVINFSDSQQSLHALRKPQQQIGLNNLNMGVDGINNQEDINKKSCSQLPANILGIQKPQRNGGLIQENSQSRQNSKALKTSQDLVKSHQTKIGKIVITDSPHAQKRQNNPQANMHEYTDHQQQIELVYQQQQQQQSLMLQPFKNERSRANKMQTANTESVEGKKTRLLHSLQQTSIESSSRGQERSKIPKGNNKVLSHYEDLNGGNYATLRQPSKAGILQSKIDYVLSRCLGLQERQQQHQNDPISSAEKKRKKTPLRSGSNSSKKNKSQQQQVKKIARTRNSMPGTVAQNQAPGVFYTIQQYYDEAPQTAVLTTNATTKNITVYDSSSEKKKGISRKVSQKENRQQHTAGSNQDTRLQSIQEYNQIPINVSIQKNSAVKKKILTSDPPVNSAQFRKENHYIKIDSPQNTVGFKGFENLVGTLIDEKISHLSDNLSRHIAIDLELSFNQQFRTFEEKIEQQIQSKNEIIHKLDEEIQSLKLIHKNDENLKNSLQADIERGFEHLKAKLEPIAPKIQQIESQLSNVKEKINELQKQITTADKSLYTCHSNIMSKLMEFKEEMEAKINTIDAKVDDGLSNLEDRLLRGLQIIQQYTSQEGADETVQQSYPFFTHRPSYYNTSESGEGQASSLIPLQILKGQIPAGMLFSSSSSTSELNKQAKSPYKVISFIDSSYIVTENNNYEEQKPSSSQGDEIESVQVVHTGVKEWVEVNYQETDEEDQVNKGGLLDTNFLTTEHKLTEAKQDLRQLERLFPSHGDFEELPSFKQELERLNQNEEEGGSNNNYNSLRMKNLQMNNFMSINSAMFPKSNSKGESNSRNKGQFSGLTKTTGHSLAPRNSQQISNLDKLLGQNLSSPPFRGLEERDNNDNSSKQAAAVNYVESQVEQLINSQIEEVLDLHVGGSKEATIDKKHHYYA